MPSDRIVIVIPARYASTRLPGKPLVDILGKPMIQHVYERAAQVPGMAAVVVATDDARIADVVQGFGGTVVMTSAAHPSGTDRLTEVMSKVDADVYINLQGDEPLIRPQDIARLADGMKADPAVQVGTLYHSIAANEALNPNIVKVVLAHNGDALYFSRSAIPYPRDESAARYFKHIGVYAYRREVLESYASLPPSMLEASEKLEQLRLLSAGLCIRAFEVAPTGPGVDTPECLATVRRIMAGEPEPQLPSLANTKLVITDVDGVLTDGGIYYDADGECMKRFHVRDGLGIQMLQEKGVQVAVLSGRDSAALRKRVADLGIAHAIYGAKDKGDACLQLMETAGVSKVETVCIGDDSIDLPAFAACGLSYAVADAPVYVRHKATHILALKGGEGAFRELADQILTSI
ncbi:MAG: 3-deoxy-manno-octulosonate cytidylyltransferase [Comamonadaceae bacterium PBBC2]|nr:MAG: 3-deoxy-manno-octulosonate cytidylyltransferase [Comamonadaceae bacterium PBBC2]